VTLPVSFPFVGTEAYYTGTATSTLVPEIFPVAINGRPYMVDVKSGEFTRQFDQRVRDSQDTSTAPGESAISPQGLWRRGQNSWHFGAGQKYSDTAESQDFRFFKSKGVDIWTKGQLTLLNATKLSLASSTTSSNMVVQDGRVYVSLNGDVKYTTDPYASSPTWTDCTGEPGGSCQAMATDGNDIYLAFPNDGVRKIDTSADPAVISGTKFVTGTNDYYMLAFAKGYMFGAHDKNLRQIAGAGATTDRIVIDDPDWRWVGVATGQNAVYAAGYVGQKSLIYKITVQDNGTLDAGIVALELPTGEVVTAISGYLGFILIGTNKGVRFCSTDNQSNLVAGQIIRTSGPVKKFTSSDRFTYFTWSNYDGISTGLGRLDLSSFTATNTPAFATDLMYTSTADVLNVVTFQDKHCFAVSGVGIVAEDPNNLVASGSVTTGIYRWGIPDDKFAPRVDVRTEPLKGNVLAEVAVENQDFVDIGIFDAQNQTRHTYIAPENKFIEAAYRFTLEPSDTNISPILTRWMSRAYAAPARSRIISLPILLHERFNINNKDYYFDVALERDLLEELTASPRIVTYQEKDDTFSVIIEDARWQPVLVSGTDWLWEGTMTVIMRTITE
jgi:hypothetical protein